MISYPEGYTPAVTIDQLIALRRKARAIRLARIPTATDRSKSVVATALQIADMRAAIAKEKA